MYTVGQSSIYTTNMAIRITIVTYTTVIKLSLSTLANPLKSFGSLKNEFYKRALKFSLAQDPSLPSPRPHLAGNGGVSSCSLLSRGGLGGGVASRVFILAGMGGGGSSGVPNPPGEPKLDGIPSDKEGTLLSNGVGSSPG